MYDCPLTRWPTVRQAHVAVHGRERPYLLPCRQGPGRGRSVYVTSHILPFQPSPPPGPLLPHRFSVFPVSPLLE
jgi:hypothetical protein